MSHSLNHADISSNGRREGAASPRRVEVSHALVVVRPHGSTIGIPGSPQEPPALLGFPASAPWIACEGGAGEVDVLAGVPGRAAAGGSPGVAAPGAAAAPPLGGSWLVRPAIRRCSW